MEKLLSLAESLYQKLRSLVGFLYPRPPDLFERIETSEYGTWIAFGLVVIVSVLSGLALGDSQRVGGNFTPHGELAVAFTLGTLFILRGMIFWFLWSVSIYLIGRKLFGVEATYEVTLRAHGLADSPWGFIGVIWILERRGSLATNDLRDDLIGVVAALLTLSLFVVATHSSFSRRFSHLESNHFSFDKAAVIVTFTWSILTFLSVLLELIMYSAIPIHQMFPV